MSSRNALCLSFSGLASRRGTCISVPVHFFSDGGAYIIKRNYRCKPVGNVSIHPTKYRNEIVVQTSDVMQIPANGFLVKDADVNNSNSVIKTKNPDSSPASYLGEELPRPRCKGTTFLRIVKIFRRKND